jgi:hypothetical protein
VTVAYRILGQAVDFTKVVSQSTPILTRLFPAASEALGKPLSVKNCLEPYDCSKQKSAKTSIPILKIHLILNVPLQIRNQPLQPLPSVMVEPCGLQPTASGKPFFKLLTSNAHYRLLTVIAAF